MADVALVVFTGGARSGKSAAAQSLAEARQRDGANVTVVVFGRAETDDAEFWARVERHRADRPSAFATVEATTPFEWTDAVAPHDLVLVDCLGTMLGLVMEEAWSACSRASASLGDAPADALPTGFEQAVATGFDRAVEWLAERPGDTIVVTNEVGDGIVPAFASGRLFRDSLGRANRRLVACADAAYLCVAGRLLELSRLPDRAAWPSD